MKYRKWYPASEYFCHCIYGCKEILNPSPKEISKFSTDIYSIVKKIAQTVSKLA